MTHKITIIAPTNLYEKILKEYRKIDKFLDVKLYSKNALIDLFYGKIAGEAFYKLIEQFHLSYDETKNIMKILPYIELDEKDARLIKYVKMKQFLIDNKLIFYSKILNKLEGLKVKVYGYSKDDETLLHIFDKLHIEADFIGKTSPKIKHFKYYEFHDIDDELNFVFNKIGDLLNEGIEAKNIAIYGLNDSYIVPFDRINKNYNFHICFPKNRRLKYTQLAKKIFNLDQINQELIDNLKFDNYEYYDDIYDLVKPVLGLSISAIEQKKLIKSLLTNSFVKLEGDFSEIAVIDDLDSFEGSHLFIVNFAQGVLPRVFDNDFLDEDIKNKLHITSNLTLTNFERDKCIEYINTLPNVFISYHIYDDLMNNPSNLATENSILASYCSITNLYSINEAKNNYAKLLDRKTLYNEIDANLLGFGRLLGNIDYDTYEHSFHNFELDTNLLSKNISYSHIKTYFQCPFSYFVKNVLKVDDDIEPSFSARVGELAHKVLEKIDQNIDFQSYIEQCEKNVNWKPEEEILLPKIKSIICYNVQFLKRFIAQISSKVTMDKEKDFIVPFDKNINLFARIDNVLNYSDNHYIIIDYKTGMNDFFDEYLAKFGLSLQLPFYSLVLSKSNQYKHKILNGVYIKPLIPSGLKGNEKKIKEAVDLLYFNGLTFLDESIENLDSSIKNGLSKSPYIKGLEKDYTVDSKKKIYQMEDKRTLDEQTSKLLISAFDNIKIGQFPIRSYQKSASNNLSCTYCTYRDICFRRDEDIQSLSDVESGEEDE